jgi:ribosomal protein S18 acetylase RimI-like enzyme
MRRAPVVLKSFMGYITGKTWFGSSQAWNIRARMYGKKRLAGTYFANSSLDDGIGTFFLNVVDANTLEGFWSGYDNVNNTITTGKYIFKRKFKDYTIRKATVEDFPTVIRIADEQLGSGYLTKERLKKTLDEDLSDEIIVAEHNSTKNIIGFSLYKHISYEDAEEISKGHQFRNMMFASAIGYIATVATDECFKKYGIGTALIEKSISNMKENGINCFISTAWKHAGIINIGSVLENLGFTKELEIPKYWYESSIREGFNCPQCGNPCVCSCVIYTKV